MFFMLALLGAIGFVVGSMSIAHAQEGASVAPGAASAADDGGSLMPSVSLWELVQSGGLVGYCILVMSLVATALVIEHFLSIRRETLLPRELEGNLDAAIEAGEFARARELCAADGSFLARIIDTGLGNAGSMFGFLDMQSAMQEVSERQVGALYRKLEYLSFIATSAPMLGLLGTVTGMIASFNTISLTQGAANPAELAGGISEALVTTCMGLILAIPATFFVSLFRNRIESYVAEAESVVERLMGRFRTGGAQNALSPQGSAPQAGGATVNIPNAG